MLSGLDEIAWDQLRHAYGEASDVPELLRGLAEGDDDALYELHGNIWHQGTVYEATAYAVPFLMELLDTAPEVAPDRAGILGLLAVIADGSSYADVHQSYEKRSTRDSDEYRARIAEELGWVRAARTAVAQGAPTLLRLLTDDQSEDVRAGAAQTLGQALDVDDPSVGDLLERAETDPSPLVRASVILAAERLQAATPSPVARWRTDPDPVPRVVAALMPPVDPAVLARDVPAAVEGLEALPSAEGDPVTWVLDRLDDHPGHQIALLRDWLAPDATEPGFRADALAATDTPIRTWRSAADELVPAIAACLADPDRDVRYRAAMSLAQAGRAAGACVDELWALLQREPAGYNTPAYYALTALCRRHDPRAASYVASRLRADEVDWAGLRTAVRLLGPWSSECREPLVSLISVAPAGNDRIAVIDAVGRLLATDPALPPALLAELADHPHVTTRVLGELGPVAAPAVPALSEMLGHEATVVRVNAAQALWRITGDVSTALPVLRSVVTGGSGFDRSYALAALGSLGPVAADVALAPYFDDEDDWVVVRSVAAHFAITGDPVPALARLGRYVHARPVGFEAVRCLASLGPAAASVAPLLREAVSSPVRQIETGSTTDWVELDEQWQDLCADALTRIAPLADS